MKRTVPLTLFLALLMVSCQEKELPEQLTASQESLNVESPACDARLEFTATRPWTASADASWCKVVPESGGGGAAPTDLHILCEQNTGYQERSCQVTIHAGGLSQTIRITQNHTRGVLINEKEFTLEPDAQTLRIPVWKAADYIAEVAGGADKWIHIVRTKTMVEDDLVLSIDENLSVSRTGRIRIFIDGKEEVLTINQKSGYVKFADKQFAEGCRYNCDRDGDGKVSIDEALLYTGSLHIPFNASSAVGMEQFLNVYEVFCEAPVDVLDLRPFKKLKSLRIDGSVKELILSDLPLLREVSIQYTKLVRLEINGCDALSSLYLLENRLLRELDIQGCQALSSLSISGSPLFKEFDLRDFPALKYCSLSLLELERLHLKDLPALLHFFLDARPSLQDFRIDRCPLLSEVSFHGVQFSRLDLSGYPSLTYVFCEDSDIKQLVLDNLSRLEQLQINNCCFESISLSGCSQLQDLDCWVMDLPHLDLTGCIHLKEARIIGGNLVSLAAKDNPDLYLLSCSSNRISTLELEGCPLLSGLYLNNNQLTALDLSAFTNLVSFNVTGNPDLAVLYLRQGQPYENLLIDYVITTVIYK